MKIPVAITSISSCSALGHASQVIWENYQNENTLISNRNIGCEEVPVAVLQNDTKQEIAALRASDVKYKSLDDSVLYAIYTARKAVEKSGWSDGDFGINIGSSRGATQLFEKYFQEYLEKGLMHTQASPTTTLGNISSWVAQDLQSQGPEISHSITCSTALHAVLNGVAWLQSGMVHKFLAGGSEAPLTPFTIAQMKAMKIYATNQEEDYPCRAMDLDKKKNSMVLGEGAGMACLELGSKENALAYITGVGYATEKLQHGVSISADAECFQKSMARALEDAGLKTVDVVVMHAPGTIKGDEAEYNAVKKIFDKSNIPLLTTNKWKIGHTFGASGLLSLEMSVLMLQYNEFIPVPFFYQDNKCTSIKNVMVNAVGFGGNAVSIVLTNKNYF